MGAALILFQKLTGTINGVCLLNVFLGIGFIAALSTTSSTLGGGGGRYEDATGWIAVMGASIIFGATGIPFKTPSLNSISPDPIIFAFYSSVGIFLVSLPLGVYLWSDSELQYVFQPWSILGSFDILVTTFLAFQTVQQVGYAKGPAIWATVGMVFSFVIGAVAFQETITNMVSALLSIPSLVVGMLLIISCQEEPDTNKTTRERTRHEYSTVPGGADMDMNGEESTMSTLEPESVPSDAGEIELKEVNSNNNSNSNSVEEGGDDGHSIDITETADSDNDNDNMTEGVHVAKGNILWGVVLGVLTGLVDGSLMVPFKMTKANTNVETYQYLVSFGFSSLITTPVIFTLYYFYLSRMRRTTGTTTSKESPHHHDDDYYSAAAAAISKEQMQLSMIPGILNGILWGLANFMSVTATFYLSMRIAFPLTQTCVLFATCWGIFYFHEIDKSKETMVKLLLGLGFFMLGTFLLAESSN